MEFSKPGYWSEWPFPSPGDLPNLGIKPRSPTLQVDSLPAEPQGKPKNTGVGSLSLLQRIFLTQVSNWDLLHCRRILYQLSYQGNPMMALAAMNILLHFYHSILLLFFFLFSYFLHQVSGILTLQLSQQTTNYDNPHPDFWEGCYQPEAMHLKQVMTAKWLRVSPCWEGENILAYMNVFFFFFIKHHILMISPYLFLKIRFIVWNPWLTFHCMDAISIDM